MTRVPGKRDHSRRLISFARDMRRTPTDAEKKLWSLLRCGQLNGCHFRRQVPIAGYIDDLPGVDDQAPSLPSPGVGRK
jgi:very-short-patch-repair endonuclease